jgi:hypothetical protein
MTQTAIHRRLPYAADCHILAMSRGDTATPLRTLASLELVFGGDTGWCWLTLADASRGVRRLDLSIDPRECEYGRRVYIECGMNEYVFGTCKYTH